jgi:plasmid segregation protein ParM
MRTTIGLDVGRSAVKVVAIAEGRRTHQLFPSYACPAVTISDEMEAMKARRETVEFNGASWFFGETAYMQGRNLASGLSDDWVATDEHAALFMGGLKALENAGVPGVDDALILVGLPGRTFESQRSTLASLLSSLAPEASIRVVPQPAGPYYNLMFSEDGTEDPAHVISEESWAVVEVGHYTCDFMLFRNGRYINWALNSTEGVRVAAQELQRLIAARHGVTVDLNEAAEILQTHKLKNFGRTLSVDTEVSEAARVISTQVIQQANTLFETEARKLTGIILAGGGAPLVYPYLKDHWPTTQMPLNPRFSVAEGYARYAQGLLMFESQTSGARARPGKASKVA